MASLRTAQTCRANAIRARLAGDEFAAAEHALHGLRNAAKSSARSAGPVTGKLSALVLLCIERAAETETDHARRSALGRMRAEANHLSRGA